MFRIHLYRFILLILSLNFFTAQNVDHKKVIVKQALFNSYIKQIEWVNTNYQTVLCRTKSGHLYRSNDHGHTWEDITSKLSAKIFQIKTILTNENAPRYVVILGNGMLHHISRNGGGTFMSFRTPEGSVHTLLFHPNTPCMFLISVWTSACNSKGRKDHASDEPCRHDLYVTMNCGATFSLLANYVIQFSWGQSTSSKYQNYVYLSKYEQIHGDQHRNGGWSNRAVFGYIIPMKSKRFYPLVERGNKFLASNEYLFVAKSIKQDSQRVELLVSTNNGKTFNKIRLPEELHQYSYTILDTAQNAVVIHVNHGHVGKNAYGLGNVYISNASGISYTLSLPRNVRAKSGACDLDVVAGVPFIYLANFHMDTDSRNSDVTFFDETSKDDKSKSTEEKSRTKGGETESDYNDESDNKNDDDEYDDDILPLDSEEADMPMVSRLHKAAHSRTKNEPLIKTVISFDKGGAWSYVKPPAIDSQGKKITCAETFDANADPNSETHCSLHLHSISNADRFTPFYSVEKAVGLVVGIGNVGHVLSHNASEVNTYISRDGGLNWIEAHKGSFIYEFGNYGGLIVMADSLHKTSEVIFSWNEGLSWYDFKLGNDEVFVENIITDPSFSSVEFLLYGKLGNHGVIYHLNFSGLQQPTCINPNFPDSVSSDYETWIPSDGRTNKQCLGGLETKYTRRKTTSECFNKADFKHVMSSKPCQCSELDYECEYGFTRLLGSLQCVPQSEKLTHEQCTSSAIFYTDAYRKVPGNQCEGGWKPEKVPIICPETAPLSNRAHFVLSSFFCLTLVATFLTCVRADKRFNEFMGRFGVKETLSSAGYHVLGKAAQYVDHFQAKYEGDKSHCYLSQNKSPTGLSNPHMASHDVNEQDLVQFVTSNEADEATSTKMNAYNQLYYPQAHYQSGSGHQFHIDDDDDDEHAPPLLDFTIQPQDYHDSLGVSMESITKLDPPPSRNNTQL